MQQDKRQEDERAGQCIERNRNSKQKYLYSVELEGASCGYKSFRDDAARTCSEWSGK